MFNAISLSRPLWLIQTHSLLLVLWRSRNGNTCSCGIVSVSERRILPHIAWGEVSLLDSDTVFDLGFPARGTMCLSQQFSEGHFVFFFWGGGGGRIFFFIILTDRVLMCYQQMQWSRVNWTYSYYLEEKYLIISLFTWDWFEILISGKANRT